MSRVLSLMVVCAVAFSVMVVGQAKPNFAGTWKPVPGAAAGNEMFTVSELTAVQDAASLNVTATSSQMGAIKTTYKLDGSEGQSPLDINGATIDRVTKAAWDGDKLVLTATSNFNGQSFEIKEIWSIQPDGSLVVETTRPDFQGGGAPVTTKATYKKA